MLLWGNVAASFRPTNISEFKIQLTLFVAKMPSLTWTHSENEEKND